METHEWMIGRDEWVDGGIYSALYMLYVMLLISMFLML